MSNLLPDLTNSSRTKTDHSTLDFTNKHAKENNMSLFEKCKYSLGGGESDLTQSSSGRKTTMISTSKGAKDVYSESMMAKYGLPSNYLTIT